jgi:hypothetical protein
MLCLCLHCIKCNETFLTPKNIFLLESKPAANILARKESCLSTKIRQANREIVLCITFASFLSPGSVSITTKSIGDSEDLPTYKITNSYSINIVQIESNDRLQITSTYLKHISRIIFLIFYYDSLIS